ncbi:shikimate/quinate 5-dehydrogenase [Oleiphilus messinensis]|uniref:Shikimate/quinate 5-dehydrogenase n=1 Tax=Oleiphilus messinensis TaxID=141451 RepID=A0A1Y0IBA9_9GAMM|nr:dehydrogenase [Oleiphilus messinensis]ARU56704.1 shikimate/quinate 5-dehydrogenase [Oleiphilus messinensis]
MKKIISISLGPSSQDYEFSTRFLDESFSVQRIGTDGDETAAWEHLQKLQSKCDVVGVGMVSDDYAVGDYRFEHPETKRLTNVVTRVPVTTGARIRRLLQCSAVRHVQKKLGNYFDNNKVLFLSGMENYEMAMVMSEYTPNLKFADPVIQTGVPKMLNSITALEMYALGKHSIDRLNPVSSITPDLPKIPKLVKHQIRAAMKDSHVIVGTCSEILKYGDKESLEGKTLITSSVMSSFLEEFKKANVNLVIDVTPDIFDQVIGVNVLEAMIIGATNIPAEELSMADMQEIIKELDIKPSLIHPTGEFRNIRRFAFVIHPLSAEYIRNVSPIPKKLAGPTVMKALEKTVAYSPPFVYSEVKGIKSPTGAEAEGWLITVGGTPKEMLAHSPEFTYKRLLAAAKMAEKMGAQIMGLGAFTKVVGDAGVTVAKRSSIPITTGNSYSASGALWAAADAMRRMNLVKPVKGKKLPAKTMVVGATGSIGSVSARLLAMAFEEVYLSGRNERKLNQLKESMLKDTPDAKIFVTTDSDAYLEEMDMIVTSTSGAGKKILDITKVKPGCVITDVARPLDLPPSEVAKRPDVLVIESGEIELPVEDKLHMRDIKLPQNVVFACMAETIVLALEGRFEVFTIGRNTEWEKVKEIYKLGLKHGMKLAAISGVNGVFTDEDIERVRKLAVEARKTWKTA